MVRHPSQLVKGTSKNCRFPALGKLAGPYETLSRPDFLRVRRQSIGGLCSIFRGALKPWTTKENLRNAKMGQLQGLGTQLPQGFSISPDGLERIFQVFPKSEGFKKDSIHET